MSMMEKIETTSTAFYYIANKLKEELLGGYINNVQTIDKDVWKIKIHKKQTKQLVVSPDVCFITNYQLPVAVSGGFEKYLKKVLYNQKIHELSQNKNNRLIYFKLDKYYLIFEFFSSSNIILTDLDFKIITSKKKEEWKDRKIIKNEIYKFPAGEDIKIEDEKEIIKEIKNLDEKEIIKYFSKRFNIAPVEINNIENKTVKNIKKIYEYKKPILTIIEKASKKTITVEDNKEETNIFENIEKIYIEKYKIKVIEKKDTKKDKLLKIIDNQRKTKIEFENNIITLDKEGEVIYSYFTIIDEINKSINGALNKKVNVEEIIKKINAYLEKGKQPLKILEINQKKKTYKLITNK